MGILTDILKEAPLSAVLMEKIKTFETEKAELQRQLDDCRRLNQVLQGENENFSEQLSERVVFHNGVEFKKGRKTGNRWQAFCPVCHDVPLQLMPHPHGGLGPVCPKCKFRALFESSAMEKIIAGIGGEAGLPEKIPPATI